jgi:hypothetical protein
MKKLGTTLFQNGGFAFRSSASSDIYLKLRSSVMSASFQAWPGELQTAVMSTSLFPIVIQTPLASTETWGGRST